MQTFFDRVERLFTWIGISALFLMVCITVVDTTGRYLFNSPLPGSYEVTEKYLMVFAAFFGFALAYGGGAHIRLTLLTDRIRSKRVKVVVNFIAQTVSVLVNMFLLAACFKLGLDAYKEVWDATKFKLPMWPAYAVTVIGLFFAVFWMTADLWQVKKGKSHLFKEEEADKGAQAADTEFL